MPTPFMHLQMAERMRSQADDNGRLASILSASWPAFYLGSVAPDCQDDAGVSREATHFYGVPPRPDNDAVSRMWAEYPQLADSSALPQAQAVFVAAYCVHLLLDLVWFRQILMPYFVNAAGWAAVFEERRMVHHIILTYLDKRAYESLPETAVATLAAARPDGWLPFVSDAALQTWQKRLVAQLMPAGALETVSVYAGRLGISPAEFTANLEDPEWMERHVFQVVPVADIEEKLKTAVADGLALTRQYLQLA